jgi:hypothetical protein
LLHQFSDNIIIIKTNLELSVCLVSEPMLNPTETSTPQGFMVIIIIIVIAIFKMYDYLTTRYKDSVKL